MKRQYSAGKLAAFLVLGLLIGLAVSQLFSSARAAEETEGGGVSPWAYDALADAYSMGLWEDSYNSSALDPVTEEQLSALCAAVAEKLALLEVETRPDSLEETGVVVDLTRGGVTNALYQQAAAYAFPGIEEGPQAFFRALDVLRGDEKGQLHLERTCTLQEAVVLANRMVLALYDGQNTGSLGLLWKATHGENTLYLLGTIHTDRDNVYPIHRQLRELITASDLVAFELDLNDVEGAAAFAGLQVYSDGTTLKDHISPELYQKTVEAGALLGLTEKQTACYKPWALANTFQSLSLLDESSNSNPMAIDLYVNAKAVNVGVPVEGVETYQFQAEIFDTLSSEYQEGYLATALALFLGEEAGIPPELQEALEAEYAQIEAWMEDWKTRDVEGFAASYDKEAILASGDELNAKLFAERDPAMTDYASRFLQQEGSHTGMLVVGAGHMIGETGIVQGLRDLGYTVELVPVPEQ